MGDSGQGTVRPCRTPAGAVTIRRSTSNTPGKGCGEKGALHYWWECKLIQPLRRTARRFLNNLRQSYHMTQQPHFWADILRKPKFKKYRQRYVHSSTTHNSGDTDAQTLADTRGRREARLRAQCYSTVESERMPTRVGLEISMRSEPRRTEKDKCRMISLRHGI